jgi:hypothetical protein
VFVSLTLINLVIFAFCVHEPPISERGVLESPAKSFDLFGSFCGLAHCYSEFFKVKFLDMYLFVIIFSFELLLLSEASNAPLSILCIYWHSVQPFNLRSLCLSLILENSPSIHACVLLSYGH